MKPENRRQASWEKQLSVVEEAFELRLEKFSTVEEVLAFGGKCLKNENLRESFTWFGFEAAEEQSLSWAAQVAFVHLQQERENLDRDLSVGSITSEPNTPGHSRVFNKKLQSAASPIDLDQDEPGYPLQSRNPDCVRPHLSLFEHGRSASSY